MITIRNKYDRRILSLEILYGLINLKAYSFSNYFRKKIMDILLDILKEYSTNTKCALWGLKEDVDFIRDFAITNNCVENLVFIYENRLEMEDYSEEDYKKLTLLVDNCSNVIMVSYQNERYLVRQWFNNKLENNFIDLYDMFLLRGIALHRNVSTYRTQYLKGYTTNCIKALGYKCLFFGAAYHSRKALVARLCMYDYFDVYKYRKLSETCKEIQYKIFFLKQLIRAYIDVRDYKNAFSYMDEYHALTNASDMDKLKTALQAILKEIEIKIKKRNKEDIIIEWLDSIPFNEYEQSNCFSFLKKEENSSVVFSNAYSIYPNTRFTLFSILSGKLPIDDKLYEKDCRREKMFPQMIKRHGAKFCYIGPYILKGSCGGHVIDTSKSFPRPTVGQVQWEMLIKRQKTKKPLCIIAHCITESHEPYYSGTMDSMHESAVFSEHANQCYMGYKYLDDQLEWYDHYNDGISVIYMSDHGVENESKRLFSGERVHVLCVVKTLWFQKAIESRVFSLKNLYKIVEALYEHNFDRMEICDEVANIQNYDYYNKIEIEKFISRSKTHRIDTHYWMQQRAVKGLGDLFIKYINRDEEYILDGDEETNQVENDIYSDRVNYLRSKCGDDFIDIQTVEFFKYSMMVYEGLGIKK